MLPPASLKLGNHYVNCISKRYSLFWLALRPLVNKTQRRLAGIGYILKTHQLWQKYLLHYLSWGIIKQVVLVKTNLSSG